MRLRYLVTLKGTGKVNRKVSPRVIYIYIYIYIYTYMAGFNKICVRATGKAVWCSTPERTENTTVTKEPEVRNLPRTFLFILQNKVNETICRK